MRNPLDCAPLRIVRQLRTNACTRRVREGRAARTRPFKAFGSRTRRWSKLKTARATRSSEYSDLPRDLPNGDLRKSAKLQRKILDAMLMSTTFVDCTRVAFSTFHELSSRDSSRRQNRAKPWRTKRIGEKKYIDGDRLARSTIVHSVARLHSMGSAS